MNGGLMPSDLCAQSNKRVWWKCQKGHEWQAPVNGRTGKEKRGCPICANHTTLQGYNDLASMFPDIAREWNIERNGDLSPEKVVYGSGKRVWWKCDNGHEWQARIVDRTNNHGSGAICPYCLR